MTPYELSAVCKYERTLGIQVPFRELPPLPRPIGLVADVYAFLASTNANIQPPTNAPKSTPTPPRSFSGHRRRR